MSLAACPQWLIPVLTGNSIAITDNSKPYAVNPRAYGEQLVDGLTP